MQPQHRHASRAALDARRAAGALHLAAGLGGDLAGEFQPPCAQGAAADRPTLEETIDAMVAPSVFEDAATTVRAAGARIVRGLVLGALGLSAMLAGLLRLIWKPAVRAGMPGEGARG